MLKRHTVVSELNSTALTSQRVHTLQRCKNAQSGVVYRTTTVLSILLGNGIVGFSKSHLVPEKYADAKRVTSIIYSQTQNKIHKMRNISANKR